MTQSSDSPPRPLNEVLLKTFLWTTVTPIATLFIILIALVLGIIHLISQSSQAELIQQAQASVTTMAREKADNVTQRIRVVQSQTAALQAQANAFYQHPRLLTSPPQPPSTALTSKGILYKNVNNGGACALQFTDGTVTEAHRKLLASTEVLDPLLCHVQESSPSIPLTYFMTKDNLLRMAPWSPDLQDHIEPTMQVPRAMVYYNADLAHNPTRRPKWTNVYLDHIGYGWMVSCTAPVLSQKGTMEGVVGVDLVVEHFRDLLQNVPDYIHPILVDRQNHIIFTTKTMEERFGLCALKHRLEPGKITEEFIFPDEFSLLKTPREDIARQMKAILSQPGESNRFQADDHTYIVGTALVTPPGWTLLILGDEVPLLAAQKSIDRHSQFATLVLSIAFLCCLGGIVLYLRHRTLRLGQSICEPIAALDHAVAAAASQKPLPPLPASQICELDHLAYNLGGMNVELQRHRNELQEMVRERTQRLEESNGQLSEALREKEAVQAALIHSERMSAVGTLVGGVAHEFNNINVSVIGYADLGARTEGLPPEIRGFFQSILRAGRRAKKITQNMLAFVSDSPSEFQPGDLRQAVTDALDLIRHEMLTSGVDLVEHLEPTPVSLMDEALISQVALNLLINASHAMLMQDDKRLTVSCGKDKENVFFRIEDNGCGMSKETRRQIFTPFFSTKGEKGGPDTPFQNVRGTGLGLSVCHTIVRNHDGEISFDSAEGHGTTFFVQLPYRPPAVQSIETPPPPPPAATTDISGRILVLDDEPDVCEFISHCFRHDSVQILTSTNGAEAIQICGTQKIDIVVLDLQMPSMDGFLFAETLRQIADIHQPAILIATGKAPSTIREDIGRYDIAGIIQKPFEIDSFREAIIRLCGGKAQGFPFSE